MTGSNQIGCQVLTLCPGIYYVHVLLNGFGGNVIAKLIMFTGKIFVVHEELHYCLTS